jgi:internalin A
MEIGQLTKLEYIDLSGNVITHLPETILGCKKLRYLSIENNILESLPGSLKTLPLQVLNLQTNPGLGLSSAITGQVIEGFEYVVGVTNNPQAILEAYYAIQAADATPLNEIKLVLVGRGEAGKTSIARRLVKNKFSKTQKETPGIDISRWKLDCGGPQPVKVNLWDFAGQIVTHATHQFFLSESSVYILVLSGRADTQKSDAEYWLRLIRAFACDGQGNVSPVIVALNKFNEHPFKVDRNGLKEKYPFVVDFIETDCETAVGIAELKALLAKTIANVSIIHHKFKDSWLKIKRALETAQKTHNYLPYSRPAATPAEAEIGAETGVETGTQTDPKKPTSSFQEICAKHHVHGADRQRFLADVFHALGVALNYGQDERLRDATVLNPRWVTDGIYRLLREAVSDDGKALLTIERVAQVLHEDEAKMQRYLVELMRRFDLAFPLGDAGKRWLVPQRLAAEQPALKPEWINPPADTGTRLRYRYAVIPEGLLPRFITRTYPLNDDPDNPGTALPRWINGVVLANDAARALIRVDSEERMINIVVQGPVAQRKQLLGVIRADFGTIHGDIKGLDPIEEMEIFPQVYSPVTTMTIDEAAKHLSAVGTDEGTKSFQPTEKLNQLSDPLARDKSAWRSRVFISYSSKDARQLDHLLTRLKPLITVKGLLDVWHDRYLSIGGDWDGEIKRELKSADVILFLISAEFCATDYINDIEVKLAIERAEKGECIIVAIKLENVNLKDHPLAKYTYLPRKGTPIRDMKPQRKGWEQVERELGDLLETLRQEKLAKKG